MIENTIFYSWKEMNTKEIQGLMVLSKIIFTFNRKKIEAVRS